MSTDNKYLKYQEFVRAYYSARVSPDLVSLIGSTFPVLEYNQPRFNECLGALVQLGHWHELADYCQSIGLVSISSNQSCTFISSEACHQCYSLLLHDGTLIQQGCRLATLSGNEYGFALSLFRDVLAMEYLFSWIYCGFDLNTLAAAVKEQEDNLAQLLDGSVDLFLILIDGY